ncbi:MAG: hypothetical protein AAGA93_28400, partial [Actinomycetota bacterium]
MKRTPIVLLAVLGLLLAACGADVEIETTADLPDSDVGVDGSVDGDPAERGTASGTLRSALLGPALDRVGGAGSARFEGTTTVVGVAGAVGNGVAGEFTMTFAGSFDAGSDASEVSVDLSDLFSDAAAADPGADVLGGLFTEPLRTITVGETTWVRWGLLAMFGGDDRWLESDTSDRSMAAEFGLGPIGSPLSLLERLADAEADVEVVGTEDVRGVTTTRHRAVVDVASLAAPLSDEQRAALEDDLGAPVVGRYLLEVWIDDDELVHRFE